MDISTIITTEYNINKIYNMKELLGQGTFSKVYMGIDTLTNESVAIKQINHVPEWCAEDEILSKLSHPNIVRFMAVHKTPSHTYLVTEFILGRELRDIIIDKDGLDEPYTRKIFIQVISAVKYLHDEGYAHRDLKIENILVNEHTMQAKVIDFGFAMRENYKSIRSGSPEYASPELISGGSFCYKPADIWALGIILYVSLYGKYPFSSTRESIREAHQEMYWKIINVEPNYQGTVSDDANMLIHALLDKNPKTRPIASEIDEYNWLKV